MKFTDPTPIFKVQDDGTETVDWKPPTARDYQAQREFEQLAAVCQGLERAVQTAAHEITKMEELVALYQSVAEKHQDMIKTLEKQLEEVVWELQDTQELHEIVLSEMQEELDQYKELEKTL